MDEAKLGHLSEIARPYAHCSNAERQWFINKDKWISIPFAENAIAEIDRIIQLPRKVRMPCLLIYGESGMGKSFIRHQITKMYQNGIALRESNLIHPIPSFQLVACPDEKRFMSELTRYLNAPMRHRETVETLERAICNIFKRIEPAALLIDEFNNIDACSRRDQMRILNFLKYLSNEFHLPLITFGTTLSVSIIQSDAQIARRFSVIHLPQWKLDNEFVDFVYSIIATFPLRRSSEIKDEKVFRELLSCSQGITGEIEKILRAAALIAVGDEERITPELIKEAIENKCL